MSREEKIEFSNTFNQKKNQIITLINDLALEMQEESIKLDANDFLTHHKINMSTNKFDIEFSFQDVRF